MRVVNCCFIALFVVCSSTNAYAQGVVVPPQPQANYHLNQASPGYSYQAGGPQFHQYGPNMNYPNQGSYYADPNIEYQPQPTFFGRLWDLEKRKNKWILNKLGW